MTLTALQEQQRAEQMVERFVHRFQPSYRLLAYHAALPLILTPELVNYLRVEFLRDENIPWVAEVDLLLSDLCRQVGYELYAMDTTVRAYLLEEMKRELGKKRMQEVAKSLIGYVHYLFRNNSYISPKELQAQQWAAMVYLEGTRQQAVKEIAEAFEQLVGLSTIQGLINQADLARLVRITQELAPELSAYQVLVDYADVLSRLLANDVEVKSEELSRGYEILPGKRLDLPEELIPDRFKSQVSVNPFRKRYPITNSEEFFGREELIQEIFEALARGQNISLVGEAGIGKTSILHQICNQGKESLRSITQIERNFVYLDLQLVETEEEFYQYLCNELNIPNARGYQLSLNLENKSYVVCVDEIEKLTNPNFTLEILSQLRGLAQDFDAPIKLVVASRSSLNILFPASKIKTSPFFNIFITINVPAFSWKQTADFLKSSLTGTGIELTEQRINKLFEETQGHPVHLQEAAAKLYNQIISSRFEAVNFFPFEFETVTLNKEGEIIQRQRHQARYFIEILNNQAKFITEGLNNLVNEIILEMVEIPGGSFIMGAPYEEKGSQNNERHEHRVTVPSFYMSKYAITQAQWRAVASLPQVNRELKVEPSNFKGEDRPVEQVSWYDAVEFCARLSQQTGREYRLPSEAEWEYACRAGTRTAFHCGETITTELANYRGTETYGNAPKGNYRKQTIAVGSFPANAFGLYDMHGNVREWCMDTWHSYEGAPVDGRAWINNNNNSRMLRGGSWFNNPESCRSAIRVNANPEYIGNLVGFRVVCVAPKTQTAFPTSKYTVDLRGKRVADAERILGEIISEATGLIRIIHGHGTGRLRKGIHAFLQKHPRVSHYEAATQADGGTAVTIAYLM